MILEELRGTNMRRTYGRVALTAAITVAFILGSTGSAAACSCGSVAVAEQVRRSEAVYIARPRPIGDLLPGASFRVLRVLKGPPRSNLRVRVTRGPGASCGTSVQRVEYVITASSDGQPHGLNLCNQNRRGATAVQEAELVLGRGAEVPWRPDLGWLGHWILIAGVGVLLVVFRRRRSQTMDDRGEP